MSKSIVKIAPDINKYLRNVFTIQTKQDIAKFWYIITQTLKALDLLLKQSLLGIVVFYTKKTPKWGEHSWDQGIVSLEAIFS